MCAVDRLEISFGCSRAKLIVREGTIRPVMRLCLDAVSDTLCLRDMGGALIASHAL